MPPGDPSVPSPGTALQHAFTSPSWWANGVAGFLARGGIILFALPIWSLPTPVGVSLLLGQVDVTGPPKEASAAMWGLAGISGALLVAVALAAAASDLVTYTRLLDCGEQPPGPARVLDGSTRPAVEPGWAPAAPPGWGNARLIAGLVVLEAIALVPAVLVSIAAAARLVAVGRDEYFLPSSLDVPFAIRVIAGARTEVAALIGCLVLADLVYAVTSRWFLHRRGPRLFRAAPPARFMRAARGAVTWLVSWFVTAAFVLPGLALVARAWAVVRDLVAGRGSPASPAELAGWIAAIAFFVACWGIAVVAAGASSVIRSVMWSATVLR